MTDTPKKKNVPIGVIVAIVAVLAVIGLGFITYASAVAFGSEQEEAILATQNDNRQVLAQTTTSIKEMAQVPTMAADDLSRVMESAFQGRYGENGSQAAVQLIVEADPGQIDPVLYRNIQTRIESGRIQFMNNQTKLVDQKRVYQTNLRYLVRGFWLRTAGFPTIDLDAIQPVSSTSANRAFETGVDDGITLRPAQ